MQTSNSITLPTCYRFSDTFCLPLAPKLVRLLDVGLVINSRRFPAFRVAFEPAALKWDIDPEPFMQRASDISQGVSERGFTHDHGFWLLFHFLLSVRRAFWSGQTGPRCSSERNNTCYRADPSICLDYYWSGQIWNQG